MTDNHSSYNDALRSSHHKNTTPSQPPAAAQFATDMNINYFGLTNFRNQYRKFGIKVDDRLRHVYVIGKSGMGKSTLLEGMIINDIYAGHGVGVIDPHGDLAENILRFIPEHRMKDVVYFNPSDYDFPIGFNILETVPEKQRDKIANGIKALFKKIWPDVWSPRMEYILDNIVLALLEFPGATLMSISRMIADEEYRDQVIANVKNPAVKPFWTKEYASWNDKYKQEAVAPVQNKVGQFLAASLIRNIVAQTKSTFNIRDIMDSRKIFIVNLSKGAIGEDNSKLLGGMLVTKLYTSAMERVDIEAKDRKPFFLYVDEFQNFATESFADILSEARKYGLSLTMAHQYMKQLDEKVLDAVIGNVGTMISFRIGSGDSEILAKEFTPTFLEEDFLNLPKYQIYLKLLIDGVASSPFSAQTIAPTILPTSFKDAAIQYSREHYTVKREVIEKQVLEWSGMAELGPDEAAHLGEIDKDHDGVPDFLQFKNKPKKDMGGAMRSSAPSARREGGYTDRAERPAHNMNAPRGGGRNENSGSFVRKDDARNRPPRESRPNTETQKVLLVDPAQPGISLTSILPKKEPVAHRPENGDNRRDDRRRFDRPREGVARPAVAGMPTQNHQVAPRQEAHPSAPKHAPRPPSPAGEKSPRSSSPVMPPRLPPRPPTMPTPPARSVGPSTNPAPRLHSEATVREKMVPIAPSAPAAPTTIDHV